MKNELVKEIIRSLKEDPQDWTFGRFTADNKNWGIELWTANIPVYNLYLYSPTEIKFSIVNRFRIYRAMKKSRENHILNLKNKS